MVVRLVFLAHLKLSNTCFFIAIIPYFFDVLCLFCLALIRQETRTIFLIVGQNQEVPNIIIVVFCWAIWITRNDVVFDKGHPKTFLRVLFSTGYGFGLYCSARMTTRNGFLMLTSYQNREPWSSSHRMDGLSFTILDFSFEHVISFNYRYATVISLD